MMRERPHTTEQVSEHNDERETTYNRTEVRLYKRPLNTEPSQEKSTRERRTVPYTQRFQPIHHTPHLVVCVRHGTVVRAPHLVLLVRGHGRGVGHITDIVVQVNFGGAKVPGREVEAERRLRTLKGRIHEETER